MKHGYIVQEISWEYNDEFNYKPEGDAACPLKIFLSKEKAEAMALDKNVAAFRGTDIANYSGDGIYGVVEDDNDIAKIVEILGIERTPDDCELEVPEKATREQVLKVMKLVSIRFYEVVKVPLEE